MNWDMVVSSEPGEPELGREAVSGSGEAEPGFVPVELESESGVDVTSRLGEVEARSGLVLEEADPNSELEVEKTVVDSELAVVDSAPTASQNTEKATPVTTRTTEESLGLTSSSKASASRSSWEPEVGS